MKNNNDDHHIYEEDPSFDDGLQFCEDYKAIFSIDLDWLFEQYDPEETSRHAELYERLLMSVGEYLMGIAEKNPQSVDTEIAVKYLSIVKKMFRREFLPRIHKAKARQQIGLFAIGLHFFGSSKAQAQKSVAEWTDVTARHVRDCYEQIEKRKILEAMTAQDFVKLKYRDLIPLYQAHKNNPFPDYNRGTIAKTHKAFGALCQALEQINNQHSESFQTDHVYTLSHTWHT